MAEDKPKEEKEAAPKPVRKVKKTLPDEPAAIAATPKPEAATKPAPKPRPKPVAKAAGGEKPKRPAPKSAEAKKEPRKAAPKKPAAEKPAPKPAVEKEEPKKKEEKAPAKERKKPAKAEKKKPAKKGEKKEDEDEEAEEEEEEHEARKKPELTDAIRAALRVRFEIARRRPTFYRQEWFRHPRLGLKWRKPQGGQSKLRRHLGYRINVVSIGFRGPKPTRGLHPSGFREVLIHTVAELKSVDPKTQAVRIAGTVGGRKREAIHEEADELGIRILNRREE